ncbi:class I SAM-dependent methyltransferase [Sphingoaurantiacus capsulatus]|uniref:Class I SAM-dependent methyltransferase n=1 Tax=Sphingoaurantiacus capsulatus TaxID=1771310 RepID=A0ABV7XGE3_9SPHN
MEASGIDRGKHLVRADGRFLLGGGLLARLLAPGFERGLDRIDKGLAAGTMDATLPDGRTRRLGGRAPGPHAEITLRNWMPLIRVITGGSAGFARSYFDGDWDSADPTQITWLFMLNRHALGATDRGHPLLRWLNKRLRGLQENTREGSRRNISFHYDLGNDFYAAWLDETMTYSSAVYAEGDDLAAAQRRKVRVLLDRLDLKPGDHLLEIGCGWGSLAEIAAAEYGARVTGLTLSAEQLAYAEARIAKAGLSDKVDFQLCDYRDVKGQFDHVASVEMFEAVGERYWRPYMDTVRRVLKPGGRAALQVITIDEDIFEDYRLGSDFIQTYIFPGGMLPSEPRLRAAAEAAGLRWDGADAYGQDYARTLHEWRDRYDAARTEGRLPPGFDARFDKIWRFYLMYCEGGFRSGGIDVVQVTLTHP